MWFEKESRLNHATIIMTKAGKLKFVKVCGTLYILVAKNSTSDEKRRTRREYGSKLLREPGNLQEIIMSEIPSNLDKDPSVPLTPMILERDAHLESYINGQIYKSF